MGSYDAFRNPCTDSLRNDRISVLTREPLYCEDIYLSGQSLCGYHSLDFEEHDPDDNRLFYDTYSGRYFESSVDRVLQGEYHLNRNYTLSGQSSVNNFYEMLGISAIDGGDYIGWSVEDEIYWIDFDHQKVILDDGLEVCVIDMVWTPTVIEE